MRRFIRKGELEEVRRSPGLAADPGAQYEREIFHLDSLILLNHVADS